MSRTAGSLQIDRSMAKTGSAYPQTEDWQPPRLADNGRSSSSSGTCRAIQPLNVLLLEPGKTR
jgi:hypothetical protein